MQIESLDYSSDRQNVGEAILWFMPQLLDGAKAFAINNYLSSTGEHVGIASLASDYKDTFVAIYASSQTLEDGTKKCPEKSTVELAAAAGLTILAIGRESSNARQKDATAPRHATDVPCQECVASTAVLKHDSVDADAVVITREMGTFKHQIFSVAELALVHADAKQYANVAERVIKDPNYMDLDLEAPSRLHLLQQGVPIKGPRLSLASQLRLSWCGALAKLA